MSIADEVPEKVPEKVPNKSEEAILRLLAEHPRMTRAQLAEQVGLTDNGVKKIMAKMTAAGWIERKGSNRSGYWHVKFK